MRRNGCPVISELKGGARVESSTEGAAGTFGRRLPEGEREIALALPSAGEKLFP